MGRNLYKLTKNFDNVMVVSILWRSGRFSRVFAEYLKNGSTDFYQTYVIFRELCIVSYEIKDWRQVIYCCYGNQFMGKCCSKHHNQREEKWHFS